MKPPKKKQRIIEQLRKLYPGFAPWSYDRKRARWVGQGVACEARIGMHDDHASFWLVFDAKDCATIPANVWNWRNRGLWFTKTTPTASI